MSVNLDSKIAILTTSAKPILFNKTIKSFPQNIDKYYINGEYGVYGINAIYMALDYFKSIKNNYRYLIFIDEDVIIKNEKVLFSLIDHIEKNNIDFAGTSDGGYINHRVQNPFAMNLFFTIVNIEKILPYYSKAKIAENQYIFDNEFELPKVKLRYKFSYDTSSLFEPYYCFYFWLLRNNFKPFYLDSTSLINDYISTQLYFDNQPFLIHTWYSRKYGIDQFHTNRIDKIIDNEIKATFEKKSEIIEIKASFLAKLKYLLKKNKFITWTIRKLIS